MRDVQSHYSAIRDRQLLALRKRKDAALKTVPALAELLREEATLQTHIGTVRAQAVGKDRSECEPIDESLAQERQRLMRVKAQIKELLAKNGLDADALELRYDCEICRDTGYVGGKRCACLERKLYEQATKESNLAALEHETFEAFDESVFPEENGQRAGMNKLREKCERFAETFPQTETKNMLLWGGCGVGKSFLLNCIAARVMQRGFSVRRLSAYQFAQLALEMVRGGDPGTMRELERVDLLVIDDLGSEPQIRNVTTEQLYAVVDERLQARKHTLFATNLDTAQLADRYGERMLSRLLNTKTTHCARLTGKDVRLSANKRGV